MKLCRKCSTEKQESEFGKRATSPDGLSHMCKECQSAYDKKRANLPHRVIARKVYAKSERGKEAGGRAKRRWQERNAVKRGAEVMVGNAIQRGKLAKPSSCSECGSGGRIHGHHDDYAKPLEVRWLCPKCHTDWHKVNGPGLNSGK